VFGCSSTVYGIESPFLSYFGTFSNTLFHSSSVGFPVTVASFTVFPSLSFTITFTLFGLLPFTFELSSHVTVTLGVTLSSGTLNVFTIVNSFVLSFVIAF
jgi:hypothetical protein